MDFVITDDMKSYFKKISKNYTMTNYPESPIENNFDFYYLSLLVGLYKNKKNDLNKNLTDDKDSSVSKLRQSQIPKNVKSTFSKFISAIYLTKEIKNQKINTEKRANILRFVENRYPVDTDNDHVELSSESMNDMNSYAQGGFEYMRDNIAEPQDLLIFYDQYLKLFK
jgi:hypothetical protein